MNDLKKNITVALIAFIDGDKVLLNRRADADSEMWEFIGGGIEKNESALLAIQREIREEVGYEPTAEKDDLQFVKAFRFENDKISAKIHFFKAIFPGIDVFSDSDETFVADLKLFSVEDALNLTLLPITREIIEKSYID